ncbi:DNA polymerase delta, subunit 4-domain-containing protein [Hypoxylon sp. FL1284]|nr:DNA polymerase delta, subunit 4-domain-containing protein [Hypoxylon sp. FL1284]
MPNTRRSSSAARRPAARQATLSFNHRVTKPTPKTGKDLVSASKPKAQSPLAKHVSSAQPEPAEEDDVAPVKAEEEEDEEEQTAPAPEPEATSEAELRAARISSRQIDQYWRGLERERVAKRVHQEGLTVAEKVLRYWDVSSHYGPCVGITRMKRWKRAEKLGLNPPLEVLAVLLEEEHKDVERAHMDEILNSTAIGAV